VHVRARTFRHVVTVLCAVALLFALNAAIASSGPQTSLGDVFATGTHYGATTYTEHMNYFLDRVAPRLSVDIAMPDGTPLYAPRDGSVTQVRWGYGGGWGVSIIWESWDGREELHLGHLSKIVKTGKVEAGDLIALVGHTGRCFPKGFSHLHIDRMVDGVVVPVMLSGTTVTPGSDPSHPRWYTSTGPAPVGFRMPPLGAHAGGR